MVRCATKRLYVSADERIVGVSARRLFSALERSGYALSWSQIGREHYPTIGAGISASDALLAVINPAWASSTFHAMEVTFALGEASYEGQPPLTSPPPVFAYVEDQSVVERHFIETYIRAGTVVRLPDDPDAAGAAIDSALRVSQT